MSPARPLPPRPSLEFAHKEAKAFLRRLREHDPETLARARERHPALHHPPQLADAQLVIAREYGFASWPRLVHYFSSVERQQLSSLSRRHGSGQVTREKIEWQLRSLMAGHGARRSWAARTLAAMVPRFYGMRIEDVLDLPLTDEDARLAVARSAGFSGWDALLASSVTRAEVQATSQRQIDPFPLAAKAMEALDLAELQRLVAAHDELLHPTGYPAILGRNLMGPALAWERKHGRDAMRPIMDWLTTRGLDRQVELNVQLCGRMKIKPALVQELLDQGADPNWVAPNGVSVLEHALIRYWNAEAVDVLARRAVPREAFWIAAGLGDVAGVGRFLDRDGRPAAAARSFRPPFDLVGPPMILAHPDPDDEEILLESFLVAMLNSRTRVLEYMVSRGTPLNSLLYGSPLISLAVGNAWTAVVECLVRCGANLDLRGTHPDKSPRELAREHVEEMPGNAEYRRIAELCGVKLDR